MIWIRADANKEIGTGHVMRCLSVARELTAAGEQVCFLVADTAAVPLLEAKGQEYLVLGSDYRQMEAELPKLRQVFEEQGRMLRHPVGADAPEAAESRDFCLVDSYFVTAAYMREIQQYMPVGYVDDRGGVDFVPDLLINYNIFADEVDYPKVTSGLVLGMEYAPLREEFRGVDYRVRREARQVLITTGGSDKYNLAGKILEKALANPETAGLKYCVVSGVYNEYYGVLKNLEERYPNVEILSNVSDMSRLMRKSDIAVTAGGSTMYELSAVGVPIICFSFVDNQEQIVAGFVEKELVCYGGNYLQQGEGMLAEVVDRIVLLATDEDLRKQFSEKQRRVVDGFGAGRIAGKILQSKR